MQINANMGEDEDNGDEQFEWLIVENNTQSMLKQTWNDLLLKITLSPC